MMTTTVTNTQNATPVSNPRLEAEILEKLITARIGLLLRAPFFGNLATRFELVSAAEWCPTAATDGRKFYYNPEFIKKLSLRECEFLFGHEILHVAYDYFGRRGHRDPRLWNIAHDYCVNADLIEQRVGQKITTVPILYDVKYQGMCGEEVYDDLFKNAKKINMSQLLNMLLDEHLEAGDQSDSDCDGSGDGDQDGKNKRPSISAQELKQIQDEVKEAILQAAQSVGAGNVPKGIKRLIGDLTAPRMNWRELLRQQIESTIKSDFSWMRPSRRGWHMDAILPGMKPQETIDICVAIDTSGSISDEMLRDFLSEIQGIMTQYDDFEITVWTFDTRVYNPETFTQDNGSDLINYKPQGGGGTDFMVNWDYMKLNDIQPKKLVVFTDMEPCGSWGDPIFCDTIFVAIDSNKVAPFGVTVKFEGKK
jgi:predicted metal-dependent peptidase